MIKSLQKNQEERANTFFLSKKKASAPPLHCYYYFYTASPLDKLIDASDALSAADAGGDHAVFFISAAKFVEDLGG